jgi:hypothetical protein
MVVAVFWLCAQLLCASVFAHNYSPDSLIKELMNDKLTVSELAGLVAKLAEQHRNLQNKVSSFPHFLSSLSPQVDVLQQQLQQQSSCDSKTGKSMNITWVI